MQRTTFGTLVYYQFSQLLEHDGLVHGVFTRLGGASRPPWHALNTGHTVGDDPAAVRANHESICRALGLQVDHIVSPHQVHGSRVVRVSARDWGRVIEATDALITDEPGVPLMLRFADCVPLWLYDPRHRAIGLAHAGWRGTVQRVAEATVRQMGAAYGIRPADLIAGIGPAIGPCCYEVGTDVVHAVRASFGEDGTQFLTPVADGHWRFDLWSANRYCLTRAGVTEIEVAGMCTACHTEEWFSHRAEHGRTGRIGALIALRS
ncbi:MAG: peptidoglycan editing factor PgeF [Anaerolineae bacterium]|nr:peptidoglycan editing factor PgeF [Anaerolineae bacterium]